MAAIFMLHSTPSEGTGNGNKESATFDISDSGLANDSWLFGCMAWRKGSPKSSAANTLSADACQKWYYPEGERGNSSSPVQAVS
jgi:hypothetical protein